jgi:two-component system NtrC family response regulator
MAGSLLIVEDEKNMQVYLKEFLTKIGYEVQSAETFQQAVEALHKSPPDVLLLDVRLPDGHGPNLLADPIARENHIPAIIFTAHGDIDMAVDAMRNGAHDFMPKPINLERLEQSIQRAMEVVSMRRELYLLRVSRTSTDGFIVGSTPSMKELVDRATRAASRGARILITGENGTGKEVLANFIYKSGSRAGRQFIDVNSSAIQDTMLESELFGYEANAFTGADTKKKIGLMEVADKGILFFDEIASMSLDMQAKLLRAIEEGKIRRVGGTTNIPVDVQIVSASNRNLQKMVEEQKFREDLYYRLNVIELHIPPLRERLVDIPELVGYFVRKLNAELGTNTLDVHPHVLQAFTRHTWPGNIRELSHLLEQAMIYCDDPVLTPTYFPPAIQTLV